MKRIIYISGVTGGILLILRIVGIFVDFSYNSQMLLSGLLLAAVCITFTMIYKYLQNRKIRSLLRKYRDSGSPEPAHREVRKSERSEGSEGEKEEKENGDKDNGEKKNKSGPKGLEPGKTSLRQRKSGLVWEGGNIKGTNATRGTKRRFIKRW